MYAGKQREKSIHFNGESDQTHTFFKVYCSHIGLAMDFIQILNETKDYDRQNLYLYVLAMFYHFWDVSVLVLSFFCPSSDLIMGVYCGMFPSLE